MRVAFSDLARQDLRSIAVFIAQDSPASARRFVAELEQACLSLADKPLRYPLIPEFEQQGFRRRPHGNYAIIYVVDAAALSVVRVLHAAMDIDAALSGT